PVEVILNCISSSFSYLSAVEIDSRHARLGSKWDKGRFVSRESPASQTISLFCQHHDGTSFRCFISKRRQLSSFCQLQLRDSRQRNECCSLAIAEGDRAGFIEK